MNTATLLLSKNMQCDIAKIIHLRCPIFTAFTRFTAHHMHCTVKLTFISMHIEFTVLLGVCISIACPCIIFGLTRIAWFLLGARFTTIAITRPSSIFRVTVRTNSTVTFRVTVRTHTTVTFRVTVRTNTTVTFRVTVRTNTIVTFRI